MDEQNQTKDTEKIAKELYEKNREYILGMVAEGKLPEPRKLTRGERKKLDAANVNLFKVSHTDTRPYFVIKEDMADWIVNNIYSDFNFDELDNNVCLWFGEYIFGLSYKNDLAAKN